MRSLLLSALAILGLGFFASRAEAQFEFLSLPSSVSGVTIRNFHYVTRDRGQLFRGAQPRGLESQAFDVSGINEVLIFKNENWGEVNKEIQSWRALGLPDRRIHHIPFRWDDPSEREACRQLIDGLILAKAALAEKNTNFYVHCSAGEDRTGVFIATLRMLREGWRYEQAFDEMCTYGYAEGNPWKPFFIVNKVRARLTPLFLKMAYFIENRKLSWNRLDIAVCSEIESTPPLDVAENFSCR